ncbi:glycosyltransferase family 2 protein [Cellulomonas iranensis]|uniref:glycosyltransferase family 2 protein n=1 Tax=Cellulomonas iranensis TaxID=76862 RepID=UPI0013D53948|nr:glycosyltransferase family 2 protein [Cellulomonas iranensis]
MSRTATTVSAVLIVKDEEAVLEECLASVAWADEVVVYDTGSSDRTREIARRLATTVVEGHWDDDFGAARNRALAHATGRWVLAIDADERFEGDGDALRHELARHDADADVLTVTIVDVADRAAGESGSFLGARLVRRAAVRWEGALHEQPVRLDGAPTRLRRATGVALVHVGYRPDVLAAKDKGARNVRIARAALDAALAADAAPAVVAARRANLARSLMLDAELPEALATAHAAHASGLLTPAEAVQLARAMVDAATAVEDDAAREHWFAVWAENAGTAAWVDAARARLAARRGDAEAALEALRRVPTTAVDAMGLRFDKYAHTAPWAWALAQLGRRREALRVVVEAVGRGHVAVSPTGLLDLFDRAQVLEVLAAVRDDEWHVYVHTSVQQVLAAPDGAPRSRALLLLLNEARPRDLRTAVACGHVARRLSLEEAATWAASLRTHGLAELCPLVVIACDPACDPRQRALAGALAWDVYRDPRGRDGLADALPLVAPEHEAELLDQLDVLAPGLVGRAG